MRRKLKINMLFRTLNYNDRTKHSFMKTESIVASKRSKSKLHTRIVNIKQVQKLSRLVSAVVSRATQYRELMNEDCYMNARMCGKK